MVELLIVIGISGLISGGVFVAVKASKEKGADAETRTVISDISVKVEEQEIAPGVVDYEKSFTTTEATSRLVELASKYKVSSENYEYSVSKDSYAIVFPLKRGGYYCIDSADKATGRQVVGLFETSGPKNCDNATRIVQPDEACVPGNPCDPSPPICENGEIWDGDCDPAK